ncbi:hypothetical protein [Citrobacter koseri]|uniref:hypothetical protein n=1 Tax=Citrobacter koseri TaxID=545 RepID=UPI00388E971C
MSVKRYDITGEMDGNCQLNEARMECTDDGIFVRYADYAALEQQLAESHRALRAETTAHENTQMQLEKMAAENAGLKAAFDKPQAYLSWHAIPPTWEDPLPCGEYLDVHDEAGHKNSDGTDCWPVFAKPEIETPATDAFLAEVRAQGVESFAESQKEYVRKNRNELDSMTRAAYCGSAVDAERFAAQLRKGAAQ